MSEIGQAAVSGFLCGALQKAAADQPMFLQITHASTEGFGVKINEGSGGVWYSVLVTELDKHPEEDASP